MSCLDGHFVVHAGLVAGDSDPSEGAGESPPVPGSGEASAEGPGAATPQERHLYQRLQSVIHLYYSSLLLYSPLGLTYM